MKYVKKREDDGFNKQSVFHEDTPKFFSCSVMFDQSQ